MAEYNCSCERSDFRILGKFVGTIFRLDKPREIGSKLSPPTPAVKEWSKNSEIGIPDSHQQVQGPSVHAHVSA